MSGRQHPKAPPGEDAGPTADRPRPRRSSKRRALTVLTVALAAAVLVAGSGVAFAVYERSRIHKIDLTKPHQPGETGGALTETPKGEPVNILMVGSDSRAFAKTSQDRKQFGAAQQGDSQRSDTMMIVRLDPRNDQATILSLARDLYVKIEGGGTGRLNGAFSDPRNASKADPDRLIRTIRTNFGIPINHYVEVDFEGFRSVVDAIGGVSIYFKYPARDSYSLLDVRQSGCTQLDGTQALAYVRARHLEVKTVKGWEDDGTGDIGRIQRQQDFIRRVVHKAIRDGLTNPVTAYKLIDGAASHLTTDSGLSVNDMRKLANQLRDLNDTGLRTLALTGTPYTTPDGDEVLTVDPATTAPVLAAFGGPPAPGTATASTTRQPLGGPTAPDAVPGPPPPDTTVEILNGTGKPGAATRATTDLQARNLTASNSGTTPTRATTQIRYRPGDETTAKALQPYLGGASNATADRTVRPRHVVIALGRSFTGIINTTITPTRTAPTSPSNATNSTPPTTLPAKGSDPTISC